MCSLCSKLSRSWSRSNVYKKILDPDRNLDHNPHNFALSNPGKCVPHKTEIALMPAVSRTWSPYAWRPMTMGFFHPVTRRGMFLQMIASLNTVPPRMLRIVPLGERHIFLRLNSMEKVNCIKMLAWMSHRFLFIHAFHITKIMSTCELHVQKRLLYLEV